MQIEFTPCPFQIGDKVRIISPLLKKEWADNFPRIVGINLKGDNFERWDFTLKEDSSRGVTDGWGVHDIKCVERYEQPVDCSTDWEEALESLVKSHREGELSEWEIHLVGRRVKAALAPKRESGSENG